MPAQEGGGGEANLKLPDLSSATFLGGINGHTLLLAGLAHVHATQRTLLDLLRS